MRRLEIIVSFSLLQVLIHSDEMLIRGTAGPLIKFFKQNGCIVIHKCKHSHSIYASICGAYRTVLGGETEMLTPLRFHQALQSDMRRQAGPCGVPLTGTEFYTYFSI